MLFRTALASALFFTVGAAVAAPQQYTLDVPHSIIVFSADHIGFARSHGRFRDLAGTLSFDEQQPENSQVQVTIKSALVDTGLDALDKDLRGPNYLDAEKYPEIRFASTKVTRLEGKKLKIEGNLTLHGTTKPVTLSATFNKSAPNPYSKAPTVGFTATGSLKRSDFGISADIPTVGDEVLITIDIEFLRPA